MLRILLLALTATGVSYGSAASMDSQFNQALALAQRDQSAAAIRSLEALLAQAPRGQKDSIRAALGRVQFQAGQLDAAEKTWSQISKSSDEWLESLEERAWVALRQKNPDRALSLLETNLKDLFLPEVGPESYFLAAYAHLRICNFSGALKIQDQFKKNFRARIVSLQKIHQGSGPVPEADQAWERLTAGKSVGASAHLLPRSLKADYQIQKAVTTKNRGRFESRLREMAGVDLKEMGRIINQFQILEVEITQRVYTKQPLQTALQGRDEGPVMDSPTRIRFKHDGEVWLDEVDKYHVRVKGCVPQGRGSTGDKL